MNSTGLCVALFVSLIFVFQLIINIAGFFMNFEIVTTDLDDDIVDSKTNGVFGIKAQDILSVRGFLNCLFGFSWSWAYFGLDNIWTLILATFIGVFSAIVFVWIYKKLSKFESVPTYENLNNLVSRVVTVYSKFDDGSLLGTVYFNNDYRELHMYSEDEDFEEGDQMIVDRIEDNLIIVRKAKF